MLKKKKKGEVLLCFSSKISFSKVKNKTKIDILILHVGWEKRSEEK